MSQPTTTDVLYNVPLRNVLVAYMQDAADFVAPTVFPFVGSPYQGGAYWEFNRDDWFRDDAQLRAAGSESAGGGFDLSTKTFFTQPYAWHQDIPDQGLANQMPPVDLQLAATRLVAQKLLLKREKLFMNAFFKTGVWTDVTGVSSAPSATQVLKWSVAGSTPIDDIDLWKQSMKRLTGFMPNVLIVSPDVHVVLKNHAEVVDRVKYGGTPLAPAFVTNDAMAALFGVDKYRVALATAATAAERATTQAYAYMSGTGGALLAYAAPEPGILAPSAGYIFGWTNYVPGGDAAATKVRSFRIEQREATRIEGTISIDCHKISADLGVFFGSVV